MNIRLFHAILMTLALAAALVTLMPAACAREGDPAATPG